MKAIQYGARKIRVVLSRTGERGAITGGSYPCRLESCNGLRIGVRWPDGKITFPCTAGLIFRAKASAKIK